MTRMDLYTMYLPRLARWEAELAADDLTRGIDPRMLGAEFERMTRALDRIASWPRPRPIWRRASGRPRWTRCGKNASRPF